MTVIDAHLEPVELCRLCSRGLLVTAAAAAAAAAEAEAAPKCAYCRAAELYRAAAALVGWLAFPNDPYSFSSAREVVFVVFVIVSP